MPPYSRESASELAPRFRHPVRAAFLCLSCCLGVALLLCYGWRPDGAAALTIFPAWLWLVPGLLLLALARHREESPFFKRAFLFGAAVWLIFLLLFIEEPRSIGRSWIYPTSAVTQSQQAREKERSLRVVTLNCSGGSPEAAAEAKRFQPDLVLWQESPGRAEAEAITQGMFGSRGNSVVGLDAAIAARGTVTPRALDRRLASYFVQARVQFPTGRAVEVISLRLMTPPFRADLWSPDCWRAQREHRELQLAQMQAVAQRIAEVPAHVPIIVGGDFNAPQGDAVFRLLHPRLRDAFSGSGLGWGNTITNEYPFLRIDQVWISRHFRAIATRAARTEYSDHRMTVCDLVWR